MTKSLTARVRSTRRVHESRKARMRAPVERIVGTASTALLERVARAADDDSRRVLPQSD